MRFLLASWGSRGDVEPFVAVGRELERRGHDVHVIAPPDLVSFAEEAGLAVDSCGLETRVWLDVHTDFWTCLFRTFWRLRDLAMLWREVGKLISECWGEMCMKLTSLASGVDLLFTNVSFEQPAANVAEYYGIPLATLHYRPIRPNGRLVPVLPAPLIRLAMTVDEYLSWCMAKKVDDRQRDELGLPKAACRPSQRIVEQGWLEIQAYEEICFPGLAAEWAQFGRRRPFVGALTMDLPTDADDEIASWIAAGAPPIYFGFGSIPVESAGDTVAMISAACAQLGQRALVCAGWSDFSNVPSCEHVKVVESVNFATTFPACRAIVHHGGAGTLAAGLRAGVPQLILSMMPDHSIWAAQLKRLKVGFGRRFSSTTQKTLVADLRRILAPEYGARAREIATQTTKPAESVATTADLVEDFARLQRVR